MKFILNGRDEELDLQTMSVSDLLREKKFSFRLRIVKINGTFIPKENYDSTYINEGDFIQMIYLMSGG